MAMDIAVARKAIHAECRRQGIDDDARRDIVRNVGKVASGSTRDVGASAAMRILVHLWATGGRPPNPWAFIDSAPADRQPLLRKICKLCREMRVGKDYAEGAARRANAIPEGVAVRLEMLGYGQLWKTAAALQRTANWGGPKAEAKEMQQRAAKAQQRAPGEMA